MCVRSSRVAPFSREVALTHACATHATCAQGLIDRDEFKALLDVAGYRGDQSAALFAQIDADGDGKLTEAEIKVLSQGKATLQSG